MIRIKRAALAALFLGLACTVQAAVLAGPVTNPANRHLYYLLTQNTWTASEAEARTLGGHLVTINDEAENQWVFTTFAAPDRNLWIGMTFLEQYSPWVRNNGQWVWASGEPVTYLNWSPGEPNLLDREHYAYVYPM